MSSKRFLLWFAAEYLPFRKAEIDAICSLTNVSLDWVEPISDIPYAVCESCTEEDLRKIASRSVLTKGAFELWAKGDSREELYHEVKKSPFIHLPENKSSEKSFKILVESFNKKLSKPRQIEKIEEFDFLPFEGPIRLKDPDNTFCLFEFYGLNANDAPEEPHKLYFGKWLFDGQRRVISDTSLQKRKFISNTSMNPTLSLLMANIAKVKMGDVVVDPFVGSGSILVAAAHFGGLVMGMDIDFKLLYGMSKSTRAGVKDREPDESVHSNLSQYSLSHHYIDVLVGDSSQPCYRQDFKFDAILCDPPYGIRESSVQVGTAKENFKIPEHLVELHVPSKLHYNLQDIISDLLRLGANHLCIGGRIAFWMPVFKDKNSEICSSLPEPRHKCFKLISISEESLSMQTSRILVCLEKVKELSEVSGDEVLQDVALKNFRVNFFNSVKERIEKKKQSGENFRNKVYQ
ncbi:tRNA (guanine(10)-N2)-methyltransferase -like protein [Halotydeus destructor]|nr:tRNA (guanine(10)-N2)-methyltransferase -like protein [Halotydeus destructor]